MLCIELATKALRNFLESELSDYSYYTEGMDIKYVDSYDDAHNFDIIFPEGSWKTLDMRVSNVPSEMPKDDEWDSADDQLESACTFEVCMYEDHYEEVVTFDWRVRYLWQALLWK